MSPRKKIKMMGKSGDVAKSRGPKRVNTAVRPIRGRRGGLKDMPTMPLDVLLEIFKYMHPRDLLYLARTTKDFRAFLMSRTSAPYWREALKNVPDVPPCPSFLHEPAYISLLFTTNCMGCGKSHSGTQWVIWELFVRYCSDCRHQRIYNKDQAEREAEALHETYFDDDDDDDDDEADEADDAHEVCFDVLAVTMIVAQVSRGKYQQVWLPEELGKNLEKWFVIKYTDEGPAFLEKLRKHTGEVAAAAKVCSGWAERQLAAKKDTSRAKREGRIAAIMERLRADGWGDEIDHLMSDRSTDFTRLEIVRRTSELTEEGWGKVWSALEGKFHAARARLEVLKQNEQMDARFTSLRAAIVEFNKGVPEALAARPGLYDYIAMPGFYDYIVMPEIEKLAGAPLDRSITKGDFLALMPALAAEWMSRCKSVLEGLVREQYPSIDASLEPLSLFVAVFGCNSADNHCEHTAKLRFPAILKHRCLRDLGGMTPDSKTMLGRHLKRGVSGSQVPAPLLDNLTCRVHVSPYPLDILAALAKDPMCTTVADLQDDNTRLQCVRCARKEDRVFTLEGAVKHFHKRHKVVWVPLLNKEGENAKTRPEVEAKAVANSVAAETKAACEASAEAGAAAAV